VWARQYQQNLAVGAGLSVRTTPLSTFETQYGAQLIGCTIVRVRLFFNAGDLLPLGSQLIAGLRVIVDADAVHEAAESPATDLHADWFMWDIMDGGKAQGHYVDVRSMRKFEELGQGMGLFFHNASAVSINVDYAISTLIALP